MSRKRRSAHTPAAKGSKWIHPSSRWAIYFRDGFRCVYCESTGVLSLDHVHSVHRGGRDNRPGNLVTACLSCNSSKQSLSRREWFARLREGGLDTKKVRARMNRAVRKPVDREVGRMLSEKAKGTKQ